VGEDIKETYMRILPLFTGLLALSLLLPGFSAAETDEEKVSRILETHLPGVKPDRVAVSVVPGIYEVILGGDVLYVTADAKYAFTGQLVDVANRTNLTEPALASARLNVLQQMPESQMIVYEPEGEVKHTITTFTDIDCPYCRKMHQEMAAMNDQGIRVRYLLYPRAGVDSESYEKAVSVWCADDRQEELTLAKSGVDPEGRQCENPVVDHMKLGERMGLTGTPLTITDTGDLIGGYMPSEDLSNRLDASKQSL